MSTLLNKDVDQIERMENDLVEKVTEAFAGVPDLDLNVHGVFSLDQLELLRESDLCNGVGVGIAYLEAVPRDPHAPGNADKGARVAPLDFSFIIVLAVPSEESCGTRHNATRLMTLLRMGIMGSAVAGDRVQRTWEFVRERPEISDSTRTLLYYSQVWRVTLPNIGNLT